MNAYVSWGDGRRSGYADYSPTVVTASDDLRDGNLMAPPDFDRFEQQLNAAVDRPSPAALPAGMCGDCRGQAMPGGAIRCLDCFHDWLTVKHGRWRGVTPAYRRLPSRGSGVPTVSTPFGRAA